MTSGDDVQVEKAEVIASSVAAEAIHGSETSKILKASIFYLLFLIFL